MQLTEQQIKQLNQLYQEKYHLMSEAEKVKNVIEWNQFYKNNLDIFCEDFLEIPLHPFQRNLLIEIQESDIATLVCSRGSSKSFCTAIAALCFALTRSNCNILIVSMTLAQSNLLITSKIDKELSNVKTGISPVLRQLRKDGWMTIKKIKESDGMVVEFENGSKIFSGALGESIRGNRSQIVILDEAAICSKSLYQQTAEPTLTQRQFKGRTPDYKEEPKQIMLSSARNRTNWLWKYLVNVVNGFYNKHSRTKYGFMCVDVLSATAAGIQSPAQYYQRRKNTNDLDFQQEYLNIFLGSSEDSLFKYEDFETNQNLSEAFYPRTLMQFIDKEENSYHYRDNEIRFISCDIAVSTGENNDLTCLICGKLNIDTGKLSEEYITTYSGLNSMEQAKYMKRLFYEYKAQYFVMDTKGVGNTVFDILTNETFDNEFGITYPAWTTNTDRQLQISSDVVINDKVERTMTKDAKDVIIPFAGTSELNNMMHLVTRKTLKDGNISLLVDDSDKRAQLENADPTFIMKSAEEKADILIPFVQTRYMINEAVSLEVKFTETGLIKLQEAKRTDTKDRYMTFGMFCAFGDKLYNKYCKNEENGNIDWDNVSLVF